MPMLSEKIKAAADEIERERKKSDDDDDDDDVHHHGTAMTPPNQDFSFLRTPSHGKRSIHYDIESADRFEQRPLRTIPDNETSVDNVLRRRYIAHWGLPGLYFKHEFSRGYPRIEISQLRKSPEKVMVFL